MTIGLAVLGLLVTYANGFAGRAVAQADPFAGLPPGAPEILQVIDSGDTGRIAAHLSPESVTKSAHPGDGSPVSVDEAVAGIEALVVSNPGFVDDIGSGRFRLLAIWRPNIDPGVTIGVGTGIGPDGKRVSVTFNIREVDGRQFITGFGTVFDLRAMLDQFAGQGDLRVVPESPLPPKTGTSVTVQRDGDHSVALFAASLGSLLFGTILLRTRFVRGRA